MEGWYIRRGEKVAGPVGKDKLRELTAAGRLLPTDELAKEMTGPWKRAGETQLFAVQVPSVPPQPTSLQVSPQQALTTHKDVAETVHAQLTPFQHIGRAGSIIAVVVGRAALVTCSTISRNLSTRAQRKHELKLAKIQAAATARASAPIEQRPEPKQPAPQNPTPAQVFAPQIHNHTVVQVVNENTQVNGGCSGCSGCSGCLVLLLVIVVGLIVLAIMSDPSSTR